MTRAARRVAGVVALALKPETIDPPAFLAQLSKWTGLTPTDSPATQHPVQTTPCPSPLVQIRICRTLRQHVLLVRRWSDASGLSRSAEKLPPLSPAVAHGSAPRLKRDHVTRKSAILPGGLPLELLRRVHGRGRVPAAGGRARGRADRTAWDGPAGVQPPLQQFAGQADEAAWIVAERRRRTR
jgi:hypothetical protein